MRHSWQFKGARCDRGFLGEGVAATRVARQGSPPHTCATKATVRRFLIGRSEKAFRIRRFMSKFLRVFLLSSASKKGRAWEHGPGALCKVLSSRSFSEPFEHSGKGVWEKAVLARSSLGCSFSGSEAKRHVPENTRHVPPETPFLKLLFRTPD